MPGIARKLDDESHKRVTSEQMVIAARLEIAGYRILWIASKHSETAILQLGPASRVAVVIHKRQIAMLPIRNFGHVPLSKSVIIVEWVHLGQQRIFLESAKCDSQF